MAVLLDGQTQARAQIGVNVVCPQHYAPVFSQTFANGNSKNEMASKLSRPEKTVPTAYHYLMKINVKSCKFKDLEIGIELTRTILMPRFSNFLRNSIIQFCMFLYLVTCYKLYQKYVYVPIYPYLINEWRRNCSAL